MAIPSQGGNGSNTPASGPLTPALIVVGLTILGLHASLVASGHPDLTAWQLLDTDPYTRLVRVEALWQHGKWFDSSLRDVSPPQGLVQHWTRLWDAILLAGGAALAPFIGFKAGLYLFGAGLPAVAHLLALCLFIWAVRPLIARDHAWISAFLFIGQVGILGAFMIGRPDIPVLLTTLFIVHIGLILRLLAPDGTRHHAVWLGVVSALAVWHSIEAVIFVVPGFAVLGVVWLSGRDRQGRLAETAAWVTTAALLLCLGLERRPEAFAAVEFDRLSVSHVSAFALNAVFWTLLRLGDGRAIRMRLGLAIGLAAAVGLTLLALFPGFAGSPIGNMDAFYRARRFINISEYKSVFQPERGVFAGLVALPATYLLMPLLGLGAALVLKPWRSAGEGGRWSWFYVLILLVCYAAMTVKAIHWGPYLGVLSAIVVTVPVVRLLERCAAAPVVLQSMARIGLVFCLILLPFIPKVTGAFVGAVEVSNREAGRGACFPQSLFETLNDPAGLGSRRRLILAFTDSGPELLFRTDHSVLSIPNHRPQPGFRTAVEIMSARDPAVAELLSRDAGVDLILLCAANPGERTFFVGDAPADSTLYDRLAAGDAPAFLQPVPLKADADRQNEKDPVLRLYRLQEAALGGDAGTP